jgi:hypothetical protein
MLRICGAKVSLHEDAFASLRFFAIERARFDYNSLLHLPENTIFSFIDFLSHH